MLSELAGLLLLLAGLVGLGVGAALVACCLRTGSLIELALATYVLAWGWLVLVSLALSPLDLLTREALVGGIAVGVLAALAAWSRGGRPRPPALRPALGAVRVAVHRPAIAALALAVSLGLAYTVALAFFTPVNEGDALAYHVARAAFWKQEHGIGYVASPADVRLNGNPPNAEIGQLATMLLAGSDRYVALPQLIAYAALVVCVAGLARRLGLGIPEALFAALAFATLPVVVLQASGALNDLVVASFLAVAALFALQGGRAALVLLALALGLALGTKLTAVLALPTLVLVAAVGRPRREWLALGLAGLAGVALGSVWYVVNLVETGELDGGLDEEFQQRMEISAPAMAVNGLRLALDVVDMSGAARPHALLFVVAGAVLAVLALVHLGRSRSYGVALLVAALLAASAYLAEEVVDAGQRVVYKAWLVLGEPETAPFEEGWELNVDADPVDSWYGPLGALLLVVGAVAAVLLWRRRSLPALALAFALAPWALLATIAVTIVWDPWRGRFLVFGVALAAAVWGVLLRSRVLSAATAALGTTALALSLANFQGKPSGLGDLWASGDPPPPAVHTVWNDRRATVQAWLRPGDDREDVLYRFVEERIADDAHVAVAPRENDFLLPYFGPRLSREVSIVDTAGEAVPEDADWLVLSPGSRVRRCEGSWRAELDLRTGWRVERRIASDTCPRLGSGA